MLELLYKRKETRENVSIDPHIVQLRVEDIVENGMPTRKVSYQRVCVEDSFKQFSYVDFELQSILAVGAVHLLKPVSMSNSDVQSFADNVDMISSQLDKSLQNETIPQES